MYKHKVSHLVENSIAYEVRRYLEAIRKRGRAGPIKVGNLWLYKGVLASTSRSFLWRTASPTEGFQNHHIFVNIQPTTYVYIYIPSLVHIDFDVQVRLGLPYTPRNSFIHPFIHPSTHPSIIHPSIHPPNNPHASTPPPISPLEIPHYIYDLTTSLYINSYN